MIIKLSNKCFNILRNMPFYYEELEEMFSFLCINYEANTRSHLA